MTITANEITPPDVPRGVNQYRIRIDRPGHNFQVVEGPTLASCYDLLGLQPLAASLHTAEDTQ